MAFEEEFGSDSIQPSKQDFSLSSTELIWKTISLWAQKITQYILLVGIIGAACVVISSILLLSLFNIIGTLGADPFSYLIGLFFVSPQDFAMIILHMVFAIFAFVLNAILGGAAIKFTLDEYGGNGGNFDISFSHSISRIIDFLIIQLILSFLTAIILIPASELSFQAMEVIDITDPMNPIFPPGSIEMLTSAFALFVIGGVFLIYINVRFAPSLAIVIDTELSAVGALKKSWELTSDNFFHILVSYILFNIAVFVFTLIASIGLEFTLLELPYLLVLEAVVTALLFSPLSYIFRTVLYRDLSSRTSSSSLEELML